MRTAKKMAELAETLETADSIAWDSCHKIYVLMDSEQTEKMRGYDYPHLITKDEATPAEMLEKVRDWYWESCELRLIDRVSTDSDGLDVFYSIVEQR
jgi:hypothetical protein